MTDTDYRSLMQFIALSNGKPVAGESSSVVSPDDDLATAGGIPGGASSTSWDVGTFFEVNDFEFEVELEENVSTGGKASGAGAAAGVDPMQKQVDDLRAELKEMKNLLGHNAKTPKGGTGQGSSSKSSGSSYKFSSYVEGTGTIPAGYQARVSAFSFKKQIDVASTTLIRSCFARQPFKSATLIKRKAAGLAAGGFLTYVRFDFDAPLITSVNLSVDETVKEDVKFVSRQVLIRYFAQSPDGTISQQSTMQAWLQMSNNPPSAGPSL